MRKFLSKKVVIALTIAIAAFAAMTAAFNVTAHKLDQADPDVQIKYSYTQPEKNNEDTWNETIDDTISDTVDEYEMKGVDYDIKGITDIDDGYYVTVNTANESTVVSGIYIDGTYYIATLKSDHAISHAQAENTIYNNVCEQIVEA